MNDKQGKYLNNLLKYKILFLQFLLLWSSVVFANQKIDVQHGKWQIISQMDIPGMPIKVPPVKHFQCITKQDLVPKQNFQRNNCKVFNTQLSVNKVNWDMQCQTQAGNLKGTGEVSYQRKSFNGGFVLIMPGPQGNIKTTTQLKGFYVGPCH